MPRVTGLKFLKVLARQSGDFLIGAVGLSGLAESVTVLHTGQRSTSCGAAFRLQGTSELNCTGRTPNTTPNSVWAGDITYIPTKEGWL